MENFDVQARPLGLLAKMQQNVLGLELHAAIAWRCETESQRGVYRFSMMECSRILAIPVRHATHWTFSHAFLCVSDLPLSTQHTLGEEFLNE
jgi:hypothetical protein